MKKQYYILALIIIVVGIVYLHYNYSVGYCLTDSVERLSEENVDGIMICSKANDNYMLYNLDKYNVDFDKNSILITSYEVKKAKRSGDFLRIWVNGQTDKINIYLFDKPNLHFDEKYPPSFCIVK